MVRTFEICIEAYPKVEGDALGSVLDKDARVDDRLGDSPRDSILNPGSVARQVCTGKLEDSLA
jgi:hypothetical protein